MVCFVQAKDPTVFRVNAHLFYHGLAGVRGATLLPPPVSFEIFLDIKTAESLGVILVTEDGEAGGSGDGIRKDNNI